MDDQMDNDLDQASREIAELQILLREAEEQKNDPEAQIAAKHFRALLNKRLKDCTTK